MQHWPRFEWFISHRVVYRHSIRMKDFGGESTKQTWLYSNKPWLNEIDNFKPASMVHRPKKALANTWVDGQGRTRCSGNDNTKASQAYPLQFGHAVCSLVEAHRVDMGIAANAAENIARTWQLHQAFSPGPAYTDPWADADLLPVVAMCGV